MTTREKIAELTKDAKTQVDLDAIVAKAGDLGGLYRAHFQGTDIGEFLYEWDSRKVSIRKMA
jgi:hypothetical protein